MLALVFKNALVSLVSEGATFEHTAVVDFTGDDPHTITVQTGPAYAGWSGDGHTLFEVTRTPVPADKRIVTWTVENIDGVWTETHELADIEKVFPDLTARQLRLALITIGIHEADVDMLLVNDPEAMIEWKFASAYRRHHPLVDLLGSGVKNLLPNEIDALWIWASEI